MEDADATRFEELEARIAEHEGALAAAQDANRQAAVRLREVLLASEPAIDPELVAGETVAEVDASFGAAVALLTRIRERIRDEGAARIPAGAPPRTNGEARLTPFEKIRAGLARER